MNEQQQHPKRRKGGRTPKSAPAFHRETVNLDAAQHARFLTLYEQSGYQQYRAVGVNYNQAVKELHVHFTEKKALALLYKLEKLTLELVALSRRIVGLSEELKRHGGENQHG